MKNYRNRFGLNKKKNKEFVKPYKKIQTQSPKNCKKDSEKQNKEGYKKKMKKLQQSNNKKNKVNIKELRWKESKRL